MPPMANRTVPLKLHVDEAHARQLTEFLKSISYVEVEEAPAPPDNFQPGQFAPGEKPSDFAGIWKGPRRDLREIRAKAWKRK